jgi:hypothetical protein
VRRHSLVRYARALKLLAICRPRPGVDPKTEIAPRANEEMGVLRELSESGLLVEAYSPGAPGAVLIFDGEREDVDRALQSLPLLRDGIIEAELTELHPFQGLSR